jgi:hypothetical protein
LRPRRNVGRQRASPEPLHRRSKTALVRPRPRARAHARPRRRHGGVGRACAAVGPRPQPPTIPVATRPSRHRAVASVRSVGIIATVSIELAILDCDPSRSDCQQAASHEALLARVCTRRL